MTLTMEDLRAQYVAQSMHGWYMSDSIERAKTRAEEAFDTALKEYVAEQLKEAQEREAAVQAVLDNQRVVTAKHVAKLKAIQDLDRTYAIDETFISADAVDEIIWRDVP